MNFMDLVTGLCLGLMLITIYKSPNAIRLLVVGLGALTMALPSLIPTAAVAYIAFVARVLVAIGCYLYLRSHRKIR